MEEQEKQQVSDAVPSLPSAQIIPSEVPVKVQEEPKEIAKPVQQTQVYVPKSIPAAAEKPKRLQKLKDFVVECRRVLRVTKKPDRTEFTTIVRISGIGIAAIGFLGFLVHFIKELMGGIG
jgi:protein transport protein SEC61 subunit gamma-like protein